MQRGMRQRARRACLAAAAGCLLLAVGSPSGAQEEEIALRPEVFRASASSLVASVQVDREALLPVPDLFKFIALEGSGVYETSTRSARSSVFFPGNGLVLGPNLACGSFGNQFPPEFKPILDACLAYDFPLTVVADDFQPDASTQGSIALGSAGDPVSGGAARATAHAGEDATTTDAVIQDLAVLGLPDIGSLVPPLADLDLDASLLRVDSATSRTRQTIVDGTLKVDAEATLSGVRLVGGLIRLGSVRSASHVSDDANGTRTADASLEVSGVTVAGMPAQVTDQGAVVVTPGSGSGPLAGAQQVLLNELLRALDVRISTLEIQEDLDEEGAAVASVGGLLIDFSRAVEGLPTDGADLNGVYTGSIQLGRTGVVGAAFSFPVEEAPAEASAEVPPGDIASGSGDGGFVDSGSFDPGTLGAGAPAVVPPTAVIAAPTPDRGPPPQQLARVLGDLFGDRLGLLYLALMFSVLSVCVLPPLTLPARLPGARP